MDKEMIAVEVEAKVKGKNKGKGKRSIAKESDKSSEDEAKTKRTDSTTSSSELPCSQIVDQLQLRKQTLNKKTIEPVAATSGGGSITTEHVRVALTGEVERYHGLSDSSDSDIRVCEEPTSDDDSIPDYDDASSPEPESGPEECQVTLICVSLPQDQQLLALEYVKKHSFMWDRREKKYNSKLRYAHWYLLGIKLGYTRDEMMKWYKTFRLRYSKIKVRHSMDMQTGDSPSVLTPKEQFIWDNGKFLDHDSQLHYTSPTTTATDRSLNIAPSCVLTHSQPVLFRTTPLFQKQSFNCVKKKKKRFSTFAF